MDHPDGDSRSTRLAIMICLTGGFFVAELVVGNISKSLALVADSFHMLSDVLSMVIGLVAIKMAKRPRTSKLTYGYKRAEVVGGLVNGVFLLALCFTITIDAIERFFEPKPLEKPQLLLIVACVGLGINVIGMGMFCGHGGHSHGGHSHGHDHGHGHGHSHSHGHGHDHKHGEKEHKHDHEKKKKDRHKVTRDADCDHEPSHVHDDKEVALDAIDKTDDDNGKHKPPSQGATIKAVFLHVLGDALGSIAVIISALFIWLTDYSWRFYVDPIVSLVVVGILVSSSVGLIRSTLNVIMQGVPSGLDVPRIEEKISKLEGVIAVHDLHIWQLDEERCVASVHVVCKDRDVWQTLGPKVRGILHKNGIHSATIQHEFESDVATPRKTEDAGEPEKKSDEEEVITLNNSACLAPCSPDCTDLRCCDE